MKLIKDERFGLERALYNSKNVTIENCRFEGIEDGESALKECSNIVINDCYMDLRYPLWHDNSVKMNNVKMTKNCRAALWYSKDISITNSSFEKYVNFKNSPLIVNVFPLNLIEIISFLIINILSKSVILHSLSNKKTMASPMVNSMIEFTILFQNRKVKPL